MKSSSTTTWVVVVIVLIILAALLIWWGYAGRGSVVVGNNSTSTNQTASSSGEVPASGAPVLNATSNSTLGNFLVSSNGMTLYQYSKDNTGTSNCTGQCAIVWPPYSALATASLVGGQGVLGDISTLTRADGTMQVTYNGIPLYLYSNDVKPGDTTGQNFAKMWSVVKP